MTVETLSSTQLDNKKARCQTCSHFCTIEDGQRGICGVRENQGGQINVLNYGKLVSTNTDPIEKKPLFHYLPGTTTFSIAAAGCNFHCGHCQNWQISQIKESGDAFLRSDFVKPEQVISAAKQQGCQSIAYTYTEPTIYAEYALAVMKLARRAGLKNLWISNGFMSPQTLNALLPYLDAANIDLKSIQNDFYKEVCGANIKPILKNIVTLKKSDCWLELTTLIIPTKNDSPAEFKKIAEFIKSKVGADTPWHISRFSPEISYQMQDLPPTEISSLAKAIEIGKDTGLKYVYAGNISDPDYENTNCPNCNEKIIDRSGFSIQIPQGPVVKCPRCQTKLDIIWNDE